MTMADLAAWTHALFAGEIVSPASAAVIEHPGFDQGDRGGPRTHRRPCAGWHRRRRR
jgi:hypothetical protein